MVPRHRPALDPARGPSARAVRGVGLDEQELDRAGKVAQDAFDDGKTRLEAFRTRPDAGISPAAGPDARPVIRVTVIRITAGNAAFGMMISLHSDICMPYLVAYGSEERVHVGG